MESKQQLEVLNPYDLSHLDTVNLIQWDTIDKYLARAHELSNSKGQWLSVVSRIDILNKVANLMSQRSDFLALQIAKEGGKPLIDARVEVDRAINGIHLCIESMGHLNNEVVPMELTKASEGRVTFTTREPIGPVVAVSAFNHPLNLIVHQVAPAVAVGCPILIKPADDTPLSARTFVELLYEAGLPEEWCRLVVCSIPCAEKMVTDDRVAFFSFIGSAKVGWMLRSKLAPGVRAALEHGGAAPVIIDADVDRSDLIASLIKGGFYHSGQVCVSVQRIFAPNNEVKELAQNIAIAAEKLTVGDAALERTECGPLIRPREVERVHEWVREAKRLGAELLTGGEPLGKTTYAPTVLLNPPKEADVSRKEIFGPVVCVYGYSTIEQAIETANSLPFAFQASVFSQRMDNIMHCIKHLDASAVMVNDHTAFRVDWMPFAGRKQSGYGVGGIGHTMHDMTQGKMAVLKY